MTTTRLILTAACALALSGCIRSERSCESAEECFAAEACVQNVCIPQETSPDASEAPDTGATDAGADETSGPFERLEVGPAYSCALLPDGSPLCWGDDANGSLTPPPNRAFDTLSVGTTHACGILSEGGASCWGPDESESLDVQRFGAVSRVVAGHDTTCMLLLDLSIECVGAGPERGAPPPEGEFFTFDLGADHGCAISDVDETITCWGERAGFLDAPSRSGWQDVSAGPNHTCALHNDGSIECWGPNASRTDFTPPAEARTYRTVSAGSGHTCALDTDDRPICWGNDADGQSSPPANARYIDVRAGEAHTCGLTIDGAVECWGDATDGKLDVPAP